MTTRVQEFALDAYQFFQENDFQDMKQRLLEGEFGVHIEYEDLYRAIVFLAAIYICGIIASRFLRMPNLVGEIVCGILLGPPLANFVPNPPAWVLIGEVG